MGKADVKGKKGQGAQYITRNQAMRRLQLSIGDFRRLCILKGVHPREPRGRPSQGRAKTYYHAKDIRFLLHEPVLTAMRDVRAFDRRIRRAAGRGDDALARRLADRRPGFRLDHLVRERHPTFVSSLSDLDDPLSLAALFASLPATGGDAAPVPQSRGAGGVHVPRGEVESGPGGILARAVAQSKRLVGEFHAYVAATRRLTKCFLSVKGVYLQAGGVPGDPAPSPSLDVLFSDPRRLSVSRRAFAPAGASAVPSAPASPPRPASASRPPARGRVRLRVGVRLRGSLSLFHSLSLSPSFSRRPLYPPAEPRAPTRPRPPRPTRPASRPTRPPPTSRSLGSCPTSWRRCPPSTSTGG